MCQRLDRVIFSDRALYAGGFDSKVLHRECSDHAPIVFSWKIWMEGGPRRWRFLKSLCETEGYSDCVGTAWNSIAAVPSVSTLIRKLKATRFALIQWNRSVFGNIFDRKEAIEDAVVSLDDGLMADWNFEDFSQWSELKCDWRDICAQEEAFWKQKSRLHWLHEGDSNTNFFHAWAKSRNAFARFETIVDDHGVVHTGVDATHLAAVEFFRNLLSTEDHVIDAGFTNLIPNGVSAIDNRGLVAPFMMEETKLATFSTPVDAAPGIMGSRRHSLPPLGRLSSWMSLWL